MGQNQWYHLGAGAPPILVYFSGDWDGHWGYGILTHGFFSVLNINPQSLCQWKLGSPHLPAAWPSGMFAKVVRPREGGLTGRASPPLTTRPSGPSGLRERRNKTNSAPSGALESRVGAAIESTFVHQAAKPRVKAALRSLNQPAQT